jgi:hypothetical protein
VISFKNDLADLLDLLHSSRVGRDLEGKTVP